MKYKNPIPKVEREKIKEKQAIIKALVKKTKLTKEEIESVRKNE